MRACACYVIYVARTYIIFFIIVRVWRFNNFKKFKIQMQLYIYIIFFISLYIKCNVVVGHFEWVQTLSWVQLTKKANYSINFAKDTINLS